MTHARTLPRYVGAAGLIAGLLVAFPSLSHASWQAQITDVRPTGNSTPTHIETRVSSNYRFSSNDPRFYNRSLSLVSRQTVRTGALAALSRGVTHPGLALALAAAGFVYSQQDGLQVVDSTRQLVDTINDPSLPDGYWCSQGSNLYSDVNQCLAILRPNATHFTFQSQSSLNGLPRLTYRCHGTCSFPTITLTFSEQISNWSPLFVDSVRPATQSDLELLDPLLPDELVREIYQSDIYPDPWHQALNLSTLPLSQVSSPNGQAAPEIYEDVAKWAENMTAQVNGNPQPHPESNVSPGGNTAHDEMLERWDEPVPDFADVSPDWQVETIDELPAFNIGIGSGQCPPPTVVSLPFPFNTTIELSWQPICDFASMIRGVVIAVSMILSLYIVLRRV